MKSLPHALRRLRCLLAAAALALPFLACHADTAPAPRTTIATSAPAPARHVHAMAECEAEKTRATPSAAGEVTVLGGDGKPHALYWTRLDAKEKPARGTLFYLAGGPLSHMMYTDLATAFQAAAYPQLDVVLYDTFGFNCSSAIQDAPTLAAQHANLTMPAMASDFIQLKRALIGRDAKAFVMGGSHGAMLGAEIVRDYPGEIAKAVLFSGDTESGWLRTGWFRFDHVLSALDARNPGFGASLQRLLDAASAGQVTVDRPTLELALWMSFSLDVAAQNALPELVKSAEKGDTKWIAAITSVAHALLEPSPVAPPPTESSLVTTFHRCNVWFPKSERARPTGSADPPLQYLHYDSFVAYWNTLCRDDDRLGEYPLRARAATPVAVPVLAWVGDRDTFDPTETRARWSALSANLSFQVMEGWAHDFGPDRKAGFSRVATMVKAFYAP